MERTIAIVEDNAADAMILRLALRRRDPELQTVFLEDGARAVDYFSNARQNGVIPPCDLILLDLNLPRVSGFEVLEFLKSDPALKKVPVIVLSGSSSEQDIERCYAAGANCYICKPTGVEEVFDMAAQLVTYWFEHASRPARASAGAA